MTVATLRPSSNADLADDSDATFITAANNNFDFDTFTLPAGSKVRRFRHRVRMKTQGDYNASLRARTYFGANTWSSPYLLDTTETATDQSGAWATMASAWLDAPTLTQADIDATKTSINNMYSSPQIAELYVDIEYVGDPTVAANNVTSPSMTTTPTYTGTATIDTGSDTGLQAAVQARIFTAAQVAAGGFNPATSTPHWDSGIVYDTETSVTQDAGYLTGGVTYHLYLRVAQWTSGALQWSAWDAPGTATFTLDSSFDPARVDSVSATADATAGTAEVTVARDTSALAWSAVDVQRSADGGTTWRDIVEAQGASGDTAVVDDLSPPSGVDLLYRARARTSDGAISSWVEAASTVTYSVTVCWLRSAESADLATPIRLRRVPEWDHTWRNGWSAPIGLPYVVGGHDVQSGRSGSLSILCLNQVELDAVLAVFAVSPVVLLQFPSSWELGGDMWAVVTQLGRPRRVRAATIPVYDVDVDVTETVEPT